MNAADWVNMFALAVNLRRERRRWSRRDGAKSTARAAIVPAVLAFISRFILLSLSPRYLHPLPAAGAGWRAV